MFALALALKIDENEELTNTVSFHADRDAARTKVLETMLAYTNCRTVEDYIAEMIATGDIKQVKVDEMTPDQLIEWVKVEALGADCQLSYQIKKIPAA